MWIVVSYLWKYRFHVLFQMVLSKKYAQYDYGFFSNYRTYGQVLITTVSVIYERLVLKHCQL